MRSNRIAQSILVLSFAIALAGCNKRVPVAALPPPPPPASPVASPLDQADRAFTAGNYDDAARSYESYVRASSSSKERDRALFHLGLTYALRPGPGGDWTRAAANFKQLVDEYPNSLYKPAANLILSLRADLDQTADDHKQRDQSLKQLTTELDRLKKIDADRRKRP